MAYHNSVVLCLSGGILKGENRVFDEKKINRIVTELVSVASCTQLVVVIGGGNIARGRDLVGRFNLDPKLADDVGIMASILNAYMLGVLLSERHIPNVVVSRHNVGELIPLFRQPSAEYILSILRSKKMVIVGGGTGKGGVTTDTAAVRLAHKLRAGIILKGTNVRGIFSADPASNQNVEFLPTLSCGEFRDRKLNTVLDPRAIEEMSIPIRVFNILTPGLLLDAIAGRPVGSLLTPTLALAS